MCNGAKVCIIVKGVQCYELFGGIAHKNHAFVKKIFMNKDHLLLIF